MVGQTGTTFIDLDAQAETLDGVNASAGQIYVRLPLFRYSYKNFRLALENSFSSYRDEDVVPTDFLPSLYPDRVGDKFLIKKNYI